MNATLSPSSRYIIFHLKVTLALAAAASGDDDDDVDVDGGIKRNPDARTLPTSHTSVADFLFLFCLCAFISVILLRKHALCAIVCSTYLVSRFYY